MASPASVANLGSAAPAAVVVRRVQVISRVGFGGFDGLRRWHHVPGRICKCMVTTNLIEEKGIQFSPESAFKGSIGSVKDDDDDLLLKPPSKPVLVRPNSLAEGENSALPPANDISGEGQPRTTVDDREKVIESLGEVLEKAEKLETASPDRPASGKGGLRSNGSSKFVRSANVSSSSPPPPPAPQRKSKTVKSVWRKGNPVVSVQKVVKDAPKTETEIPEVKKDPPLAESKEPAGTSISVARPLVPSPPKLTPRLQAKPAVSPPTPPASPVVKKVDAPKERKPILIDKFASKKPVVDPIVAEALLATPTKPVRGPPASRGKEERRKKSSAPGASRRRIASDDDGLAQEDASELNMPIPGVSEARKGRKWTKASRRAARLRAAKAAEPVRVEILEVGEDGMSAEELAFHLAVSEAEILEYLFSKGIKPEKVQTLDKDMVMMICKEYDVEVLEADPIKVEEMAKKKEILDEEDLDNLEVRPPIVTIMGHVDHGKTTLLDHIRKSRVVASEAGGITQGIGAYQVLVPVDGKPQPCVFLDTPGHEAFGAMRARGARVTDITIIVVAADDGVRPQTSEAIAHAKAAGVPIIIAINKIDKEGANPDRVMQELSKIGLMPETWGGDIPMVQISALQGENINELLETIMVVAELQELKANPHRKAKGTVIEACVDKARGPLTTLIVQNGTLNRGDILVCGEVFGKVRAMFDDRGGLVDKAGPSTAVQVIGLSAVPVAGDEFEAVNTLDIARERANERAESLRAERISAKAGEGKVSLSSIASAVSAGKLSGLDMHQLNLILKVDFQGSIEAIRHAIQVLPQDNVSLKFLLQAPGDVSISDVDLAVAAEAIIFGFNVKAPGSVKNYASKNNVEIRLYRVIYDLIDDMRNAMEGLLEPVEEQVPVGAAEVRATFSSGSGRVAGCMVTEGKVVQECGVRVVRNGKAVHTGTIDSLRRVKEDVKEVGAGLECGIGVDDFNEWEVGDVVEAFNTVKKQRTLEEASASVNAALKDAGVKA